MNYAHTQLLMRGVTEDSFQPSSELTRGMAVTVLARLADVDTEAFEDSPSAFSDVEQSRYYAGAVQWAAQNKITNGTDAGQFSPDEPLTRQMLCAMIYRMYSDEYELSKEDCGFADFDEVSAYARDAVAALAAAGVINGMGSNEFQPKTAVTRAMLAQIIYNGKF